MGFKHSSVIAAAFAAASLAAFAAAPAAAHGTSGQSKNTLLGAQGVAAEIEKVRQATKKYEDINVALAEGYVPAPPATA